MAGFTRISKILAKSNGNIFFDCPGCEGPHGVNCGEGHGPVWTFNGDVNKPTFSPSVLVAYENRLSTDKFICHSFVRDGKIQFLSDCTHSLRGQTVDIQFFNFVCLNDSEFNDEDIL